MQTGSQVTEVLKSLVPKDPEELSLLRSLLFCAQRIYRKAHQDLGIHSRTLKLEDSRMAGAPSPEFEIQRMIDSIPRQERRYFDGLVEAMEVYHSIYGRPVPVNTVTQGGPVIRELRLIRDQCLHEGLRSIY